MRLVKRILAISMATAIAFTGVDMPVNATGYTDTQTQVVIQTQTGVENTDSVISGDSTDTKTVINDVTVGETTDTSTKETTDGTTATEEAVGTTDAESTTTDENATSGETTSTDNKRTTDNAATTEDKTTTDNNAATEDKTTIDSATTTEDKTITDSTAATDDNVAVGEAKKVVEISELQKKLNDALLENGTVTLSEDVKIDKMLELSLPEKMEKAELTIELNGFKITSDVTEALVHVSENVTLTIKGVGSLINNADQGIVIFNEGIINLDNADLLATGSKSVGVLNNSTLGEKGLIIKSGTIKAEWFAIGKTAKAEASINRPTAFFAAAGIVVPSTATDASTDAGTTTDTNAIIDTSIKTGIIEQGSYSVDESATVIDATESNVTVTINEATTDSTIKDRTTTDGTVTNETAAASDSQNTTEQVVAPSVDANTTTVPANQTVIVAPAMPLNVVATVNSYNNVKISWSPVADAQGYIVERIQTGTESVYTPYPAITTTEYIDNTIVVGKEYKYHVYAFSNSATNEVLKSVVSGEVLVKTTLLAPQSLSAIQASTTSAKLTWGAVDGAQKYNVYRATKDGEFSLITTVEGTEYTNSKLKTGTKYSYKVVAVNGDYITEYSNTVTMYAAATAVTKLKASSKEYNKINLSWKGAKGATKYEIYRSTSETDGYKKIKTVTENKYTDSSIKTGVKYYYKVVSYSNKAKGGETSAVTATAICAAPTDVKAAYKSYTSAKITWTKAKGAGSYAIYRSTSKNSGYALVGSVSKSKSSYTDKSAVAGTKYYYKIVAVANGTDGKWSKAASVSIKPAAVKDLKVKSAGGRNVNLTWTSANGAATYEVHYSKKENSGYKKLGETTDLNYTVTELKNGTTYYYRVFAKANNIKSDYAQTTYVNPKAISLSSSTLNLEVSETAKLTVNFDPEKVTDSTITWSSANTLIATVSDKGVVTALAKGITIITATSCNGLLATCEVGVDQETSGVVVVLDPGHGGSDPGALSGGLKEKDLVLKISQYTMAELEKYSGVIVKMTRTDDRFLELEERTNIAKNYNADLFVSQHLNSGVSSANGSEVYVSLNSNYNAGSTKLGTYITNRLTGVGLSNRGVKTRLSNDGVNDYYSVVRNSVAKGFPGIIVESAFLSNAEDREIISTEGGLKAIGVATATAIAEYYGLSKK